jgi:putative membrane protein
LYAQQGKAERIKSFPFPRQYAYFSEIFVGLFILLLPFGLVGEFAKLGESAVWLTIPFSILISWIFDTMEKVGDTSENPFENSLNDVPMSAISRNIEIDLRELLGESELPEPLQAVDGFLM